MVRRNASSHGYAERQKRSLKLAVTNHAWLGWTREESKPQCFPGSPPQPAWPVLGRRQPYMFRTSFSMVRSSTVVNHAGPRCEWANSIGSSRSAKFDATAAGVEWGPSSRSPISEEAPHSAISCKPFPVFVSFFLLLFFLCFLAFFFFFFSSGV